MLIRDGAQSKVPLRAPYRRLKIGGKSASTGILSEKLHYDADITAHASSTAPISVTACCVRDLLNKFFSKSWLVQNGCSGVESVGEAASGVS